MGLIITGMYFLALSKLSKSSGERIQNQFVATHGKLQELAAEADKIRDKRLYKQKLFDEKIAHWGDKAASAKTESGKKWAEFWQRRSTKRFKRIDIRSSKQLSDTVTKMKDVADSCNISCRAMSDKIVSEYNSVGDVMANGTNRINEITGKYFTQAVTPVAQDTQAAALKGMKQQVADIKKEVRTAANDMAKQTQELQKNVNDAIQKATGAGKPETQTLTQKIREFCRNNKNVVIVAGAIAAFVALVGISSAIKKHKAQKEVQTLQINC